MKLTSDLSLSNFPLTANKDANLFQDLLDIHNDIYNIAETLETYLGESEIIIPELVAETDWDNWPFASLHYFIAELGEDIPKSYIVKFGVDNKLYKFNPNVDAEYLARAVTLDDGVAGQAMKVSLYGTVLVDYLTEPTLVPPFVGYNVEADDTVGNEGKFRLRSGATLGSGFYGYYAGNKRIIFTGAKYRA